MGTVKADVGAFAILIFKGEACVLTATGIAVVSGSDESTPSCKNLGGGYNDDIFGLHSAVDRIEMDFFALIF